MFSFNCHVQFDILNHLNPFNNFKSVTLKGKSKQTIVENKNKQNKRKHRIGRKEPYLRYILWGNSFNNSFP